MNTYKSANKMAGRLKRVLILMVAIALITGTFEGCSSGKKRRSSSNANIQNNPTTEKEKKDLDTKYKVGDTFLDGDIEIVYIESGVQKKEGDSQNIFLKWAVYNNGVADLIVSHLNFKAVADGVECERIQDEESEYTAKVTSGSSTLVTMNFMVPKKAKTVEIEYASNMISYKKVVFVYDGKKNANYAFTPHMERTEWSYNAGDVITLDDANITYISTEKFTGEEVGVQPREGYHFESVNLAFENTSDTEKIISTMQKFKCYADCVLCKQVEVRNEDFHDTPVASYNVVKGTVTFEVPDDAEVIEMEYLDPAWSSASVILSIK